MRDGGKGDTPRPLGVPLKQFDNNWDAIFSSKCQHNWEPTGQIFLTYPPYVEYQCAKCKEKKEEIRK